MSPTASLTTSTSVVSVAKPRPPSAARGAQLSLLRRQAHEARVRYFHLPRVAWPSSVCMASALGRRSPPYPARSSDFRTRLGTWACRWRTSSVRRFPSPVSWQSRSSPLAHDAPYTPEGCHAPSHAGELEAQGCTGATATLASLPSRTPAFAHYEQVELRRDSRPSRTPCPSLTKSRSTLRGIPTKTWRRRRPTLAFTTQTQHTQPVHHAQQTRHTDRHGTHSSQAAGYPAMGLPQWRPKPRWTFGRMFPRVTSEKLGHHRQASGCGPQGAGLHRGIPKPQKSFGARMCLREFGVKLMLRLQTSGCGR